MQNISSSFQELIVWQKSHKLTLQVYSVTSSFPDTEKFGLVSQMRRSSASVPTNIAEGFARKSTKDSLRFYRMADGSLAELKYQLILSHDLGYLKQEQFAHLMLLAEETGRVMHGWIVSQAG